MQINEGRWAHLCYDVLVPWLKDPCEEKKKKGYGYPEILQMILFCLFKYTFILQTFSNLPQSCNANGLISADKNLLLVKPIFPVCLLTTDCSMNAKF